MRHNAPVASFRAEWRYYISVVQHAALLAVILGTYVSWVSEPVRADADMGPGMLIIFLSILGLPWSLALFTGLDPVHDWMNSLARWQYYSLFVVAPLVNLALHTIILARRRKSARQASVRS